MSDNVPERILVKNGIVVWSSDNSHNTGMGNIAIDYVHEDHVVKIEKHNGLLATTAYSSGYDAAQDKAEKKVIKLLEAFHSKQKEIDGLKSGMREIFEVWGGAEGFVTKTAPEAYQEKLIKDMAGIARTFLPIPQKPDSLNTRRKET